MGRALSSGEVRQFRRTTPALYDHGHAKQPRQAAAVLGRAHVLHPDAQHCPTGARATLPLVLPLVCAAELSRIGSRRHRCAAPLARRQRRPPALGGPGRRTPGHTARPPGQWGSHTSRRPVRAQPSCLTAHCPARSPGLRLARTLKLLLWRRPGDPLVLVKHSQGRFKLVRPAKPLKPRRDLGVIQVRMIAAAGADDLEHVGVAALEAAVHDADRLAAQDRPAAVAGLTGGRGCHLLFRHEAQPPVTGTRCGDSGRAGNGSGIGRDVRIARTAHSTHRQVIIPALPGSGAACWFVPNTRYTQGLRRNVLPSWIVSGEAFVSRPFTSASSDVSGSRYAGGSVSVLPRTRRRSICASRNPSSPSVTAGQPPRSKVQGSCTRQDGLD